jgi:predicted GNAT family N-acyltransferase
MTWSFVDFDRKYDRTRFDCGEIVLNTYLQNHMSQDLARKANVPVLAITPQNKVVGYYTLSNGAVDFEHFPVTLKKKIAPYPVPIARVGRLAVDNSMKGKGLGKELLFHAIDRTEQILAKIGIRALVVDAKDDHAEKFYLKYGFMSLQNTSGPKKTLFLIID